MSAKGNLSVHSGPLSILKHVSACGIVPCYLIKIEALDC